MPDTEKPPYDISDVETVSETEDLRVRLFTIGEDEKVPWHFHNNIHDIFVGLEGVTVVETRAPRARHELAAGQHCIVPPKTAHEVYGKGGKPCRFTLTQGVGEYDFVPVASSPPVEDEDGSV